MSALAVDLWDWPLCAPDPGPLSPEEHVRASRFVFARDRDRYIAGRGRLRRILAGYLGLHPTEVAFRYGPHGKPQVEGLTFNLSHTGDLAMLAVLPGADLALGVDIEAVRPIEMGVARTHFAPSEYAALRALPKGRAVRAFHRCWTRKEAWLKAVGTGLMTDLASFTVTLDAAPRLLSCAGDVPGAWTLLDLAPGEGVAGALAVRAEGRRVRVTRRSGRCDEGVRDLDRPLEARKV
ncbi:4'-phosphopantetheinyl transferase family protein [Jannaschia marina]|uniref:4'-phosphopantetheinyl transferase family protein n=1 Tax=Jannaschia marina TaxID=2741674 RepID=UPI0015CD52E3|nr:4'-phosphopantetheinyl transferase superfamily protein [Jannaschia marina]